MFPLLYHSHHSLHSEDISFWLELAAQCQEPVLELGCGTGRVLLPLVKAGHSAFGMDNDLAMLAVLRRNIPLGLYPHSGVFQADFTAYHLSAQFGLILLPCNTYGTLVANDRLSTLRCAHAHSSPAGVFAVCMPNPDLLKRLPSHSDSEVEELFPHPIDGEPVQVSSAWRRDRKKFLVTWHYDHLLPNGDVQRLSVNVEQYITPLQVHIEEMRQAGFTSFSVLGDFMGGAFLSDSPHLIILASRQKNRKGYLADFTR